METIIDRIIAQKKLEVEFLKNEADSRIDDQFQAISFINKLQTAEELSIIAEFKRASPSKGIINREANPDEQAKQYELLGASAVSVLTDSTFFKGSFADLRAVRNVVDLPILCKDFIIDQIQIDIAKRNGADIILLIVAALDDQTLMELYDYATSLGLEVLIEVHGKEELEAALKTGSQLIGVNNRDLKSFKVDLAHTRELAPLILQEGRFLISESGLQNAKDVEQVRRAGAHGILVGEALMSSWNIRNVFSDFRISTRKEATS